VADDHPVPVPLAFAHVHFAAGKVEVLDPQTEALEHAQAETVEDLGDEEVRPVVLVQDELHLRRWEHNGESFGPPGPTTNCPFPAYARICDTRSAARRALSAMLSSIGRISEPSGKDSRASSAYPSTGVRMLFKSWAIPPGEDAEAFQFLSVEDPLFQFAASEFPEPDLVDESVEV
jgi:hypothetical protein